MLQFVLTINVEGLTYGELAGHLRKLASEVAGQRYDVPLDVESTGDIGRVMAEDKETRLGGWHIEDSIVRFGGR